MKRLMIALLMMTTATTGAAANAEEPYVLDTFDDPGRVQNVEQTNPVSVPQSVENVSPKYKVTEIAKELLPKYEDQSGWKETNSEGDGVEPHAKLLGIANSYAAPNNVRNTQSNNRLMFISNMPWYTKSFPYTAWKSVNIENGHLAVANEMNTKNTFMTVGWRFKNDNSPFSGLVPSDKITPLNEKWGVFVDFSALNKPVNVICSITYVRRLPIRKERRGNDWEEIRQVQHYNFVLAGRVNSRGRAFFDFSPLTAGSYNDNVNVEPGKLRSLVETQKISKPGKNQDDVILTHEDLYRIANISVSVQCLEKETVYAISEIRIGHQSGGGYGTKGNAGSPVYVELPKHAIRDDGTKDEVDNTQE